MQGVTEHAGPILRLKTMKKVARNLFYLSSFARYNEFYVLILCYAITLKEDAQSYQLAFQGKPVNVLS